MDSATTAAGVAASWAQALSVSNAANAATMAIAAVASVADRAAAARELGSGTVRCVMASSRRHVAVRDRLHFAPPPLRRGFAAAARNYR
jgi:hypothetical protein